MASSGASMVAAAYGTVSYYTAETPQLIRWIFPEHTRHGHIYHCTPSASQKGVDILLTGAQELQEVQILVPASLRNTQKDEVFLNSRGRRRPFAALLVEFQSDRISA